MVFEKTLTAMVKGIRAHRGKETEYIATCLQEIQKEVTSKNLATKSMAVLKLAYLNMMGYDMSWSTFTVVEVMSHSRFSIKRAGYLASSICFNDKTDVGLLTINLFKKDFGSKSQYESGMALSCLSSICSPEICRDLVGDLIAMLSSSRPYLRKKTTLCLYRVFLTDPQALKTCFPKLKERLSDEDQGVLTATVNTFLELGRKNARNYLSLVPQLYHILVNTTNNWLSIKLLKVFQLLCPLEPRLPSKMESPLMNLINTTKAQSVEFEAIRCVVRTMPDGTPLMSLAIEKLQNFLNSSDRNLRYLGLELFRDILVNDRFQDNRHANIPELHTRVLESIEESDTTARKVGLQLLDRIVTPATFVDTVKKLMEFSKNSSQPDEFMGTILRMGARDRYALLEDFAWYLLILAEIARNLDSAHANLVAEQMIDISVRVPLVRPYAVTLALSLLDRSATATTSSDAEAATSTNTDTGSADIATPVVGACAYIIGEYHDSFDSHVEAMFVKAAKALLVPKHIQNLEPVIQTQCVWAATKLYLGAAKYATGAVVDLQELLLEKLPVFFAIHPSGCCRKSCAVSTLGEFLRGRRRQSWRRCSTFSGASSSRAARCTRCHANARGARSRRAFLRSRGGATRSRANSCRPD
jgi:AP-3 complex subunit delta-1